MTDSVAKPEIDVKAASAALGADKTNASEDTLTDGSPGVMNISGTLMRPFSYFDYRVLQLLQPHKDVNEEDGIMAIAFAMTHTTEERIREFYAYHKNIPKVLDEMLVWSTSIGLKKLAAIMEHVATSIAEYSDSMDAPESGAGEVDSSGLESSAEGNSRRSLQE